MGKKLYINAEELLIDSYRLAKKVFQTGYCPDVLIGVWRGGTPVGIAMHEYFMFRDCYPYHTAIKTESYSKEGVADDVDVTGLEHVLKILNRLERPARILLVDDVFDRGKTMEKVSGMIEQGTSLEHEIRIATIFYKPENNQTDRSPDYYLHTTDRWVVFPHEVRGLTVKEIARKNPALYELLKENETIGL